MLSIITTFGCRHHCDYCVDWNVAKLHYPCNFWTEQKWQAALEEHFAKSGDRRFSISGGGDPMNGLKDNELFWAFIEAFAESHGLTYDIHTSYEEVFAMAREAPLRCLHKVVFHVRHPSAPRPADTFGIPARFAYVVTDKTKIADMLRIEETLPKAFGLTYRELLQCGTARPPNDNVDAFARAVADRRPNSMYVEQRDYNLYLWPTGEVVDKFLR